jgi:integrase
VSEVASLKVDDIDSPRMLIRIEQGKGREDRNAMLPPQLLALLRLWWKGGKRRSIMLPHGWLFPARSATDPISTRQINRAIHEAAEAAGIRSGCCLIRCATSARMRRWRWCLPIHEIIIRNIPPHIIAVYAS